MSTFTPTQLGLTAFFAANRIDFVLNGPDMDSPERCSAFYNDPKAKLKLQGKALKIEGVTTDEAGEPIQLRVKWGRLEFNLGRRTSASGQVSYYKSLESASDAAAPKTAEQILNALQGFIQS